MGIMDALNVAEKAMAVHRFRTEVAAENVANIKTPGYHRQIVDLRAASFASTLDGVRGSGGSSLTMRSAGGAKLSDADDGAVQVAGVHRSSAGPDDERQEALRSTTDLMEAKSAFELSVRATTMLKSMALSALEIGRGN